MPVDQATFMRDAIARLQEYMTVPVSNSILLETRIEDIEIDSLDFVEWEIELYDAYDIDGEIDFLPERDRVSDVLARYAELLPK